MAKIEVIKTELVWPGKYNEDGTIKEVPRVNLPFQVIETINESRATREAKKGGVQKTLFDIWEGKEGDTFEEGWKNKLIWGDNLLVMGSLLEKFAGKIDLIYIDPPFATGADFSFSTQIGEFSLQAEKEQSIIEEKIYRDTWGKGVYSYLSMIYYRLILMRDILSDEGVIYVHIGPDLVHYVRSLMDEIFGVHNCRNEIIWQRTDAHSNVTKKYGTIHDTILFYSKSENYFIDLNADRDPLSESALKEYSLVKTLNGNITNYKPGVEGRRFKLDDVTVPGARAGFQFNWRNTQPSPNRSWPVDHDTLESWLAQGKLYLRNPEKGAARCKVSYLDENEGILPQDLWINTGRMKGGTIYPTEKPERPLERILKTSSKPTDLVADFFCGSGTTLAVAEKLGRRWIGCDLSRWAIHVTRKRLLGIENCKPFEVLNLGKYERKYWMGVTFGDKKKDDQQIAIFQYIAFMLKLYSAEPLTGMQHIHGKKGSALIHIGAVDAPVTIDEVNACIEECLAVGQSELHILGWEWEMGMTPFIVQEARRRGIKLLLLNIPREVMEQQAVDKGDIHFFEVAHLEVDIKKLKDRKVKVTLSDFAFPYADMITDDVRDKVKKWSDYIDYWAIDWNFQNDTFMNGWVAYRTRKERKLPLNSDPHKYEKPGKHTIMVKVVDIFGNDTSQTFDVEVK